MTKLEPKLRFPNFIGSWEKKKLEEITIRIGDGLHGTPSYSANSGIFFINGNNLIGGKVVITENTKEVDLDEYNKNKKDLTTNSLLISINGTIGNVARYNNERIILGKSVGYFTFNESVDFYFFLLQTENVQNSFSSELTGSTIKNLSLKTLRETLVAFPLLTEQIKIANFLNAINDKLQALQNKKSLLESYKKGIMQKIFSQELRFKYDNGSNYPNWEEKSLESVGDIIMGQSPDSKFYNSQGIGKYLIQGNADILNRKTSPRVWTSQITKECNIGDIILTVRAPVGAVAKSIHNACIGRGVCAIRLNKSNNSDFLYQVLLDFEPKWTKLEQGSTFTAVNSNDIRELKFSFPSLSEQKKIATFLNSIDEKINIVSQQIGITQAYKKGLLQQMFC